MTDRTELRRLAEAATQPGPWTVHTTDGQSEVVDAEGFWVAQVGPAPHDAAFIAAASPDVVLALLDENEALRAELSDERQIDETRRGHLTAVLAEHKRITAERNSLRADVARLEAALARWEALGERHDIKPRDPGCQCHREEGDSPCSVHGDEDNTAAKESDRG